MKKITCLFICFFSFWLYGQEIPVSELERGPVIESAKKAQKATIDRIFYQNASGFYAIRSEKIPSRNIRRNFFVEKYDLNLKLIKQEFVKVENPQKDLEFVDVFNFDGIVYMACKTRKPKGPNFELFFRELNIETLSFGPIQLVASIEIPDNTRSKGEFSLKFSPSRKFLLIKGDLVSKNRSTKKKIHGDKLWLIDKHLKVKKEVVRQKFNRLEYHSINGIPDDKGNIYVLSYRIQKKYDQNWKSGYIIRNLARPDKIGIELNLDEIQINNLNMNLSETHLVLSGFYSASDTTTCVGIYYISVDLGKNKLDKFLVHNMQIDETYSFVTEKTTIENKLDEWDGIEPFQIEIKGAFSTPDGQQLLVAEKKDSYSMNIGQKSPEYVTYYRSDEIFLTFFDKNGMIKWTKKIEKHQTTSDVSFYNSFQMFEINGDYHFLFNNEIRQDPKSRADNRNTSSNLIWVAVNKNGENKREMLNKNGPVPVTLIRSLFIHEKEYILLSRYQKKNEHILKLHLK